MTILVAVKKNGRIFLGADRVITFGSEYSLDLVNSSKIMKMKHAYLATSGFSLIDNVVEHLFNKNHEMMNNPFLTKGDVFAFFLELYQELKKNYTLVDQGKDTFGSLYNVFLLATAKGIYGISSNLSVHEYSKYAARGSGEDYSLGALYALYDVMDDGFELTRLALEAACHFSVYCREPIDILEIKDSDFGRTSKAGHKDVGTKMKTISERRGSKGVLTPTGFSRTSRSIKTTTGSVASKNSAPMPESSREDGDEVEEEKRTLDKTVSKSQNAPGSNVKGTRKRRTS